MIALRITQLQDLIGKPYKLGARGPEEYDCWGLCMEVYARAGVRLPDWNSDRLQRREIKQLIDNEAEDKVEWITSPESWCFVYARTHGHIGLYLHHSVLHCALKLGVILQHLDSFEAIYPNIAYARWCA